MITVRIGTDEKDMSNSIDEQWINQEINRRRRDGETVCVRVTIHDADVQMMLSTPSCGGGGGAGRPPNVAEKEIFDLWAHRDLNQPGFTGGNVVAFLKQLRSLVGS
jgi:hypothetical protein